MGVAYRLVRPHLSYEDVLAIKGNNGLRLTSSPFGLTPEEYARNPPVYLGKAVAWKGVKGAERFFKEAIGLCSNPMKGAALVAGLKKAIGISKKYAGVRGTVLWNGKLYPRKCIEQKKG